MNDLVATARPSVDSLLLKPEEELIGELGLTLQLMRSQPEISASFSPTLPVAKGFTDELKKLGADFLARVNRQLYELVCGNGIANKKDRAQLAEAFSLDRGDLASVFAATLVAYLGTAPAVAAIVAALTVKVFFKPGQEAMCTYWGGKLDDGGGIKKS